jgi:hypothetical protein
MTQEEQIEFLTNIIKANRLHEPYCIAFSTQPPDWAGLHTMFSSMAEKECHCWLDEDNHAEPGKGFGVYHVRTKTLFQDAFFRNRYYTRRHILETIPDISADPKEDDYWAKAYVIVPVELRQAPETPKETS